MSEQRTHADRLQETEFRGNQLAGSGRRLAGAVLELLLMVVTLGVGWLAWWAAMLPSGRTPAKHVLRLRVVDAWSGTPAGWRGMLWRELGCKVLIVGLFGAVTLGLGWALAGVLVLTATRQALWDRIAGTAVVDERRQA